MALDGAYLACLREELFAVLAEAKVDKIHQPSREELIVALRSRTGSHKLFFSVRANSARVNLTANVPENPAAPPMFCMLLRKHLTGGRLVSIRQNGWERVLYFDFDCISELGDLVRLTLAIEIMGRYSNLILIGKDGMVIDAIKRVDWDMSSVRPILPGVRYELPMVRPNSLDLSAVGPEEIVNAVCRSEEPSLAKALLAVSHGTSPLLCRELAHFTGRGQELSPSALTDDQRVRLTFALCRVKRAVLTGEYRCPYLLTRRDGSPLDYSFVPITQYGLDAVGSEGESFSAVLDQFYERRDNAERMKQKSQDVLRVLTTASDRISRKLSHQREELARSADREQKRMFGDLIHANMYQIERGADKVEVINFFDEACATVTIPLNPAWSAAQNAQKYYKDYRKAQTAERILTEQIAAGEAELSYLDSVFDALSRASTAREVEELRYELAQSGYLRISRTGRKKSAALGPLVFCSDDGFTILVGRNNVQNDQLTLRTARGNDIWLHTKNIPGSHVIVVTEGVEPPARTIEQAAMLAAYHSKATNSAQVPVEYTKARYVHKPNGARPGMVIYHHNQTAYVTPSEIEVQRLRSE